MIDYTIITTEAELRLEADYYKRDPEKGDLYCYEGDPDSDAPGESVAHVPAEKFVAIFETEHGDTQPPQPSRP